MNYSKQKSLKKRCGKYMTHDFLDRIWVREKKEPRWDEWWNLNEIWDWEATVAPMPISWLGELYAGYIGVSLF
jgi:hypothetical protein